MTRNNRRTKRMAEEGARSQSNYDNLCNEIENQLTNEYLGKNYRNFYTKSYGYAQKRDKLTITDIAAVIEKYKSRSHRMAFVICILVVTYLLSTIQLISTILDK